MGRQRIQANHTLCPTDYTASPIAETVLLELLNRKLQMAAFSNKFWNFMEKYRRGKEWKEMYRHRENNRMVLRLGSFLPVVS